MKIVFAKSTGSVGGGLVRKGTHWPADDPIVQAHPDMFTDDPRYGLSYSVEPDGFSSDGDVVVETATAAPGEKRATRRGAAS